MSNKIIRIVLSTAILTIIMVSLSALINVIITGEAHESHHFFRPDNDFRINPGLLITSFIWCLLFTLGYNYFGSKVKHPNKFIQGLKFGVLVYIFFVFCQEVFYYQFIEFDWMILAGSLVHYFIVCVLGGGLLGLLNTRHN